MIKPLSRRTRFGGLIAVGAAAVIIAAGCGGSDGGSALSVDEYRDQAQMICRDTDSVTDGLDPSNPEEFQTGVEAGAEQIEQLSALDPPEEFEEQHTEAIEVLTRLNEKLAEVGQRIESGEDAEAVIADEQDQISDLGMRADELARELGLDDCVSDDSSGSTTTDEPTTTDDTATDTLTPTPPAADSGDTTSAPSDVRIRYLRDATTAAGALSRFGEALQSITNAEQVKTLGPQLSGDLEEFDGAISNMTAYMLSESQLEAQRTCLVQTGPAVSDVLGQFVTAASDGDVAAIQGLVPEIQASLTAFSQAAQGNC